MGFREEIVYVFDNVEIQKQYPMLSKYTSPVKKAEREIVGRDMEIKRIQAALLRPELSNVLLLANAGSGKTALVQGTMLKDTSRIYLEVDLSKMIADVTTDVNQMASMLKALFDETEQYHKQENKEIVPMMQKYNFHNYKEKNIK